MPHFCLNSVAEYMRPGLRINHSEMCYGKGGAGMGRLVRSAIFFVNILVILTGLIFLVGAWGNLSGGNASLALVGILFLGILNAIGFVDSLRPPQTEQRKHRRTYT